MKKVFVFACIASVLVLGMVTLTVAKPVQNISAVKHPNLAAAQKLIEQAFQKIVDAQKANEFDLGGHAQNAKDLLTKAADELKQAAVYANTNK